MCLPAGRQVNNIFSGVHSPYWVVILQAEIDQNPTPPKYLQISRGRSVLALGKFRISLLLLPIVWALPRVYLWISFTHSGIESRLVIFYRRFVFRYLRVMWCGGASDSEIYLRADLLHMGHIFDRIIRTIIGEVTGIFLFQIGYRIHVPSSPVSSGVRGGREQLSSY